MSPSARQFAALARSSPWRWHALRFTVAWHGRVRAEPVRAWVRRPGDLRVEDLSGAVLQAGTQPPQVVSWLSAGRGGSVESLADPRTVEPERDEAGLVVSRPGSRWYYDDPMYRDYHWVAMLDPVELADGSGRETAEPDSAPVDVEQLRQVTHHGRPAWEAVLRTTDAYDPRCSCCAMLFGVHSEAREAEAGGPLLREREPLLRYADVYRVRLDVGTGVCVFTEEVGGSYPGTGHDLRIEAVDERLPDHLFAPPPRPRWWHRGARRGERR